jgi:hypothetical protein
VIGESVSPGEVVDVCISAQKSEDGHASDHGRYADHDPDCAMCSRLALDVSLVSPELTRHSLCEIENRSGMLHSLFGKPVCLVHIKRCSAKQAAWYADFPQSR